MNGRCHTQHDSYVQEIKKDAANSAPEADQVATSDTLAKEDAVMVVVFDAHVTVFTVVCFLVNLELAEVAPYVALTQA